VCKLKHSSVPILSSKNSKDYYKALYKCRKTSSWISCLTWKRPDIFFVDSKQLHPEEHVNEDEKKKKN
jgi:hypothetical protein